MHLRLTTSVLALACGLSFSLSHAEERVIFAFDDHSIPWQHNLKLTLETAQKHPENPVLRRGPEGAPDHGHAILYGTVTKVGDKFRMWYLAMSQTEFTKGQAPDYWRPMCYAESADGVHWTKPELGLVDFNGSKENNICLVEGKPFSLTRVNDFLSVLHDPADPDPARRYKAAFIAHVPYEDIHGGMSSIGVKEKRVGSTICATSADGLRWKVAGDRPANAGGERFEVTSLYRFGGFYYTTGQLVPPWTWRADGSDPRVEGGPLAGRVMLAYRSPDFKTWSQAKAVSFARPGQLANPPVQGQQTHMGAGLWNRGNVMVGLYGMWQDAAAAPPTGASHLLGVHIDLGLVLSNDGIHFREPVPGFKIIPRGKEGEWDDIALLQGHAFVNEGDKTMIWYSHWDTGGKLKNMDIGLATLRRDGFGFLTNHKADAPAMCETTPFEAGQGTKLFVNVDGVSADLPLEVELLDEHAQPIPGFSQDASATIQKVGTRVAVNWRTPLPAKQKFAVRLVFPAGGEVKLFALYLAEG